MAIVTIARSLLASVSSRAAIRRKRVRRLIARAIVGRSRSALRSDAGPRIRPSGRESPRRSPAPAAQWATRWVERPRRPHPPRATSARSLAPARESPAGARAAGRRSARRRPACRRVRSRTGGRSPSRPGGARGGDRRPLVGPRRGRVGARMLVPAIIVREPSKASSRAASVCGVRHPPAPIPASRQRWTRLETGFAEPSRSGGARQGAPRRTIPRMPLRTLRWAWAGRPVRGRRGGSGGARFAPCASLRSWRRGGLIAHGDHGFAHRP